jgi:hypothetical protein
MLSRAAYLDSYSPSEASEYAYGNVVPNPVYTLKRRIAMLNKMKDDSTGAPQSDLFQKFLIMQSNPEALFQAKAKMPNTPFGNLASFAQQE